MKRALCIMFAIILCTSCTITYADNKTPLTLSYPNSDVKIILSDAYTVGKRTWTSMFLGNSGPFESTWIIAKPGCTIAFSHKTWLNKFHLNGDSGTEYGMGIAELFQPEVYDLENLFIDYSSSKFDMVELRPENGIDNTKGIPSYCISFTYAVLSPQRLMVNGEYRDVEKYNINGSNYFKIRDVAYLLNGTSSQFSVNWDGYVVKITTGESYTPVGIELMTGEDKSLSARETSQQIYVNGELREDFSVYNLRGNNFVKLRDLGDALGFIVDFDSSTNTAIVNTR